MARETITPEQIAAHYVRSGYQKPSTPIAKARRNSLVGRLLGTIIGLGSLFLASVPAYYSLQSQKDNKDSQLVQEAEEPEIEYHIKLPEYPELERTAPPFDPNEVQIGTVFPERVTSFLTDELKDKDNKVFRTLTYKSELDGVKDLMKLVQKGTLEASWFYLPEKKLWVRMSTEASRKWCDSEESEREVMFRKNTRINLYHYHPKIEDVFDFVCSAPSTTDIASMIDYSKKFKSINPKSAFRSRMVTPFGLVEIQANTEVHDIKQKNVGYYPYQIKERSANFNKKTIQIDPSPQNRPKAIRELKQLYKELEDSYKEDGVPIVKFKFATYEELGLKFEEEMAASAPAQEALAP